MRMLLACWNAASGKRPWYFTAADGSPLLTAAGLRDEWKNRETGERLKSCTMIVTEPNEFAAEIHDRMPVFLTEQQFAPWLSGALERLPKANPSWGSNGR
jgi:putative SOS response-associated peptidase YedK